MGRVIFDAFPGSCPAKLASILHLENPFNPPLYVLLRIGQINSATLRLKSGSKIRIVAKRVPTSSLLPTKCVCYDLFRHSRVERIPVRRFVL